MTRFQDRPPLIDPACGRTPEQIPGYTMMCFEENDAGELVRWCTESEYVWSEEGTLNRENGHFLCDECYITAGMPSSPLGWTCP